MEKNSKRWWRDPRFIIPSILIPLILALIKLFPSFLPDKISNELSVSISLIDPRRSDSGLFDLKIEKQFVVDEKSESKAANSIARSLLDNILSDKPSLNRKRQKISVSIMLSDDGILFIDKPQSEKVALHLSRFSSFDKYHLPQLEVQLFQETVLYLWIFLCGIWPVRRSLF